MHRVTAGERIVGAAAFLLVFLRVVLPLAWIGAAVAAWVLLPALGGSGAAPLADIVPRDAAATRAQERSLQLFGSTVATDAAVVTRNPGGLSSAELAAQLRAARAASREAAVPGVEAAVPVPNLAAGGLRWPEQGTASVSYLFLSPELNLEERMEATRAYADRLPREAGTAVQVTGAGPARLAQFDVIEDALPRVELATVLVILLVVAIYFRSIVAPLVTLLTAAVAYVLAVRVLAWGGDRLGFSVPSEIEPVLVVLLLGLVTDYTVFFLAEARTRLLRGEQRLPAAREATRRIAPTVLTAGVVVAGGAASLLAGRLEFFRVFGPGLAVCALVVTVVCVTFVPAMLALLGPRLFGRRAREAAGAVKLERPTAVATGPVPAGRPTRRDRLRMRTAGAIGTVRASRAQAREDGRPVASALLARVLAMRPVALLVVLLTTGALIAAALGGRSADLAVSFIPSLPADEEVRRAADDAARGFGRGILAPTDVIVEGTTGPLPLPALVALQRALGGQPGVAAVLGPAQPAGTPLQPLALTRDRRAARFVLVLAQEPTGARAVDDLERVQERMPALLREAGVGAGARVSYAGETALAAETVDALGADLWRVALATIGISLLLLAVFLRALVAPVFLVASSVLAFAASYGLTARLLPDALGGTDFIYYVPLVGAVLLVGLGSDYNVLVAGRIREETRRRRPREAVAVATPAASRAITVAGVTLAATFALLALVPLRPFRELALLMTIGVLVDALVVRRLLIPAIITVLGRAAWWPGRAQRPVDAGVFLERVAERAGCSPEEAGRAAQATLQTLGERIPRREAREIARQLPEELAPALERAATCEPFGSDEFVARVAERGGLAPEHAVQDVRAVLLTLGEALSATEVEYLRASLSDDYDRFFRAGPRSAAQQPLGVR